MSKTLASFASFAAFALALVAISLLVSHPICEARELGGHVEAGVHAAAKAESEGHPCCSIGGAAPLQAAGAAEPGLTVDDTAVAPPAITPRRRTSAALASAAPVPVPRYHVRSARILS